MWILEGLAFLEAGQKSIVMHSPLLQALVQVLRRDRTEEQRAAARIIHNLSANSSLDLGPLHATPGLLPALVYLAGNPDVPANVRESAAWSIKVT